MKKREYQKREQKSLGNIPEVSEKVWDMGVHVWRVENLSISNPVVDGRTISVIPEIHVAKVNVVVRSESIYYRKWCFVEESDRRGK